MDVETAFKTLKSTCSYVQKDLGDCDEELLTWIKKELSPKPN